MKRCWTYISKICMMCFINSWNGQCRSFNPYHQCLVLQSLPEMDVVQWASLAPWQPERREQQLQFKSISSCYKPLESESHLPKCVQVSSNITNSARHGLSWCGFSKSEESWFGYRIAAALFLAKTSADAQWKGLLPMADAATMVPMLKKGREDPWYFTSFSMGSSINKVLAK